MKFLAWVLFIFFLYEGLSAQVIISGTVKDKRNNALYGANVMIRGTIDGATCDTFGVFRFETDEKDTQRILIRYVGYDDYEQSIVIGASDIQLNIVLKEKLNRLNAVIIRAGTFEASDEKQSTVLNPLDMVTTASAQGDAYGALKTLPGTQQVNEREGLFVRGGLGNETQTFIDGTMVRNAFTVAIPDLGSRGRFNPFIFKGTVFSTGGYSALYGQALSSVVLLNSIDLPEKSAASLNVTSVGIGGSYQHLSKNKKSSMGVGYNYVNLTPYFELVRQNIDYIQAPIAHQVDANFRFKTSETGMLKLYTYLNRSDIGIRRQNIQSLDYLDSSRMYKDEYDVGNLNSYLNLSFREYIDKGKKYQLNIGSCFSRNTDNIQTDVLDSYNQPVTDPNFSNGLNKIKNLNHFMSSKLWLTREFDNLTTIRFGGEHTYRRDESEISLLPFGSYLLIENLSALFGEVDFYLNNDIAFKTGVRMEYSALLKKLNVSPRISAAYKLNKTGQLSVAYGRFYQNPDYTFFNYDRLPNKPVNRFMLADHYILNYLYQAGGRALRLEAYNKVYHHLIKNDGGYGYTTGKGYARGLELFYRDKKTFKGLDYWVSYSYIDSKRDHLNFIQLVQPDFVANHVASIVFKKFWVKRSFGINGTYTYSSGRPFNDPNQSNIQRANEEDIRNFMTGRTMDFHNLAFSFNYVKRFRNTFMVLFGSINNPFGFKQVYGYNFAARDLNGDGILASKPITPPARQFFFVGSFFSWGIDRSQEVIDSNL